MAHFTWYTIRAAGITAYVLLFLTVATGLLLSGPGGAWWKGIPVLPLHRRLTWLMGAFLAIHVLVLLVDSYLRFSVVEVFVPFTAAYEPFWTGIGVLAVYLLVMVIVSTAVRRDLHNLLWYGLHLLSYPHLSSRPRMVLRPAPTHAPSGCCCCTPAAPWLLRSCWRGASLAWRRARRSCSAAGDQGRSPVVCS